MPRSDAEAQASNETNPNEVAANIRPIHRTERVFHCLNEYRSQPRFELEPMPRSIHATSSDQPA